MIHLRFITETVYTHVGGQDFTPTAISDLVFLNEPLLCTEIMLEDDSIHEDSEIFTVEITTDDSAVNLGTSLTTVTITDNDG